jgi:hypothetical protein
VCVEHEVIESLLEGGDCAIVTGAGRGKAEGRASPGGDEGVCEARVRWRG